MSRFKDIIGELGSNPWDWIAVGIGILLGSAISFVYKRSFDIQLISTITASCLSIEQAIYRGTEKRRSFKKLLTLEVKVYCMYETGHELIEKFNRLKLLSKELPGPKLKKELDAFMHQCIHFKEEIKARNNHENKMFILRGGKLLNDQE